MKIGYPCQCIGVANIAQRTCIKKFATNEKLYEIIAHNLNALEAILDYNHQIQVQLFRISSDLIPFGSSEVNQLPWTSLFQKRLTQIGKKITNYGMRVSMHPGQYTLLNALDQEIIQRSILDLRYHCDVLNSLHCDASHKLILHIGGVYGDKKASMERFIQVYQTLEEDIKSRLIIENDDRYYTLEEVLWISSQTGIPVVFDNLHHECNPSLSNYSERACMELVKKTWQQKDGNMKIHYSQQNLEKRKGAHASFLRGEEFLSFVKQVPEHVDIMLEIKDKNRSALQANYLLQLMPYDQAALCQQYQYLVLYHNEELYHTMTKEQCNVYAFFQLIQCALSTPVTKTSVISCYQYILYLWKPRLSDKLYMDCEKALFRYEAGKLSEAGLCSAFTRANASFETVSDYLFLNV